MNNASLLVVVFYSLIGSVVSLIGGIVLLGGSHKNIEKFSKLAVPFAAGALLGAVFLDLLKDGLEESTINVVMISALAGIVVFFTVERMTHWFHHHHEEDSTRLKSPLLIIVADTLHNALDGVAIASAFLINTPTGIATTIAIAAHEIPQEIGDFGVLLSKGMSRGKVLVVNLASAFATVVSAIVVYILGGKDGVPVGVLLGLSAGFLLYIAMSDLIPTIHEKKSIKGRLDINIILLVAGIVTVGIAAEIARSFTPH
jgi:zinc and cadmium transporter